MLTALKKGIGITSWLTDVTPSRQGAAGGVGGHLTKLLLD